MSCKYLLLFSGLSQIMIPCKKGLPISLSDFFVLFYYCIRGYIVEFTKVPATCEIYHTWIHLFHHSPLSSSPPPIPDSFNRSHFPITYMCTQYLHHIHPPTPFPLLFSLPTGTNPPSSPHRHGLFHPPILQLVKEKNDIFCSFKIAI
jgi:hypothetical protein